MITQRLNHLFTRLIVLLIKGYQWLLSPWLGCHCRFYPSCSQYAIEAHEHYGWFKGGGLTLKRLAKCHPWHPGGVDMVPSNTQTISTSQTISTPQTMSTSLPQEAPYSTHQPNGSK